MSMDHLFKALDMFSGGMQKLAVSNGISEATSQINEISNSQMQELEKRQANEMVAKNLALRLTSAQANPAQIAQAVGAIQPQAFKDGQDMYLTGVQKGDQQLQNMGTDAMVVENLPKEKLTKMNNDTAVKTTQMNNDTQLAIAGMRADSKTGLRPLPQQAVKTITDIDLALERAGSVTSRFAADPELKELVGPQNKIPGVPFFKKMTNSKFADFVAEVGQDFDMYRQAITGAGAGAAEIKMLMENRPTSEDTPETFQKKWATIIRLTQGRRSKTIDNLGRAKFDTSGFAETDAASAVIGQDAAKDKAAAAAPQAPSGPQLPAGIPQGSVKTRAKNKALQQWEDVWKAPDGTLYPAQ